MALVVKKPSANARYMGSIPGTGRSPGGRHGNLLQYSCPENPMDRRACPHEPNPMVVYGVAESDTTEAI